METDANWPECEPKSLRWLCENLLGVRVGTARFQKVLGCFLEFATGEGAKVVHSEEGPIGFRWPDGTWLSFEGLAVGVLDWPAHGPVH